MNLSRIQGFEGWYFKHQKEDNTISFIPGHTNDHSFIQVISNTCSCQFNLPTLSIKNGIIRAGNSQFSKKGCIIDLPGITGKIVYQDLTPLHSDIMGPFKYLPMQCRHGVISMHHRLSGNILINDECFDFTGGNGYTELDCGTSFPRSYLWLHCNDFTESCSIMLSIAHIPIGCISFTGCICAIIYKGHEYRLATYNGVRILVFEENHICLLQGKTLLEVDILPSSTGHPLLSPIKGKMSGTIRESSNAAIHIRFSRNGKSILNLKSEHATYEYVP